MNDSSEKKKEEVAQSKAAGRGRQQKSRHVQEPLRKDGKCMHLLKAKNKNKEDVCQPVRSPCPDISCMS